MRRVFDIVKELLVAVGLVWLIPFALMLVLLPVAGVFKLAALVMERL